MHIIELGDSDFVENVLKSAGEELEEKYDLKVSDYFFHAQCQRRFCFKFLGLDSLIQTEIPSNHDQFRTFLMNQGIIHEKNVLGDLKKQGTTIISMKATGSQDSRFKAFLEQLNTLIPKVIL